MQSPILALESFRGWTNVFVGSRRSGARAASRQTLEYLLEGCCAIWSASPSNLSSMGLSIFEDRIRMLATSVTTSCGDGSEGPRAAGLNSVCVRRYV